MTKIQETKNIQIMNFKFQKIGYCFLLFVCTLFLVSCIFATSSTALSDPKFNITNVIKQYVVAEYPEWKDLDVKVSFKSDDKLFKGLTALKGSVDYKILEVYKDFKPVGNVIFPIVVKAKGFNKKIFVRAKVEVYKMVVVAQETIPRGQVLNNDSLSLEQRDIAMLPQKFYSQVEDVMLTEAKTSIPKNSTIFAWMVKEVPLVRRGDELMVIVKGTNLLVKRLGKALEDGYLNQAIRIKMDNSKNPIEGVLISTDEVVVKI